MATPEEIRRESDDINRRQTETNTAQARTTSQSAIAGLLALLHTIAQQITAFRLRLETADANLKNWIVKHPEFTKLVSSPSYLFVLSIVLLLIYAAAYWLDVLLLSHNSRLLVKDFADGNETLIYAAIFGVPLVILLMETYFQTQWTAAETIWQKWLWGILSVLMCFAIPVTIVGFSMATASAKAGTRAALVQNWQLVGKAVLALFAHSAILLGGSRLHEAKSYLIYKVKDKSLQWRSNRLTDQINLAEVDLTNRFTDYFRQLNEFNTTNPQNQIEPGPFNQLTRTEINRVFGYVVIAEPPVQNTPPENNGNGGDIGGETVNNPPSNPANQDQNYQPNGNAFNFAMDGEDEVRP